MSKDWKAFQKMLADLFRQKRIEMGLTQKQLADKLGISQELVSKNERSPSRRTIQSIRYALRLGIKLSDVDCYPDDK